ncbi:MAG TPA: hypothetical protein VNU21_05345 [Usitatibacter sp.]|jgi:hypothetical protein|nr:hypothetical protein [Usitatibacter sp.]
MRVVAGIAALAIAGCAAPDPAAAPAANAIALRNAGFESARRPGERCPVEWGCSMHSNPDSFRFWLEERGAGSGAQSLCIERVLPEPWATAAQSVPAVALRGRKVRFSLLMRGEGFDGEGVGPIIIATAGGATIAIAQKLARIGTEWRRYAVELVVPPQAEALEVGATLFGAGRACVDDARLEPA